MVERSDRPTPQDLAKFSKEKAPIPVVKFMDSSRKGLDRRYVGISTLSGRSIRDMLTDRIGIDVIEFDNEDEFMNISSLRCEVAVGSEGDIIKSRRGIAPFEREFYSTAARDELITDLRKRRSVYKEAIQEQTKSIVGTVADYVELFAQGLLPEGESIITNSMTSAQRNEEKDVYVMDCSGGKIREADGGYRTMKEEIQRPSRIAIVTASSDGLNITDNDSLRTDKSLVVFPLLVPKSVSIKNETREIRKRL